MNCTNDRNIDTGGKREYIIDKNLYTFFFLISKTFIRNTRLKLAKNQAKAKQHPEAEFLLSENYLLCLSTLSSKTNRRHSEKCEKASVSVIIGLYH